MRQLGAGEYDARRCVGLCDGRDYVREATKRSVEPLPHVQHFVRMGIEELVALGLSCDSWGTGATKHWQLFLRELKTGERNLVGGTDCLVTKVEKAVVYITREGRRRTKFLFETKTFADGTKISFKDSSVSGKLYQGESPVEGALREIKDELKITDLTDRDLISFGSRGPSPKFSSAYPSSDAVYHIEIVTRHEFGLQLPKGLYRATYREDRPPPDTSSEFSWTYKIPERVRELFKKHK